MCTIRTQCLILVGLLSVSVRGLTPRERAEQLAATMTTAEKLSLLGGGGRCPAIGCMPGVPRLKFPGLNLEDGPNGVPQECVMMSAHIRRRLQITSRT